MNTADNNSRTVKIDDLKEKFAQFLKQKRYRNTQERYLVLDHAFEINKHFSADELYLYMRSSGVKVSRATVYSTLDLLTKCDILVKHRFHGDGAHFELADKMPNHHHVICVETGRIVEFQDEQIQKIAERICAEYGYKLIRHSFQIFGVSEEKIGEAKQVEEFEFLET